MDGISYLDMIIARFQSPVETHDLDISPANRLVLKVPLKFLDNLDLIKLWNQINDNSGAHGLGY